MLRDSRLVRAARAAMSEIWRSRESIRDSSRLCVEPLERRLLLANFVGTDGPDTIHVSAYGGMVYVDVNGVPQQTADDHVYVYAHDGNDTVFIGQIGSAGDKPLILVDLGGGDDYVGMDSASLDASIDGIVIVQGGNGNDTFNVDASASSRINTFEFNIDGTGPYLQAGRSHDGGFFQYDSALENITLEGSAQDDLVTMIHKPGATHLAVIGAGGDDEFLVGAGSDVLGDPSGFSDPASGWLAGTCTVSGGVGDDRIVCFDQTGPVDPAGYIITSSDVSKASTGVHYVTLESQSLYAADGSVINVNGTNAFTSATINASNCTINLNALVSPTTVNGSDCVVNAGGGNLDNLAAPVTLNMSATLNADLLNINDRDVTDDTTYIFGAGSFTAHDSTNPINFNGLDQIVLQSGAGNDLIAVEQLAARDPLAAHGNAGDDTLTLSQGDVHDSILAPVSFDGGVGSDTFVIANALAASSGVLWSSSYTEAGVTHTYANCELVRFVGGALDHTNLEIDSLSIPASIRGGSAADSFQVGGGSVDDLTGQVTIDGQGGNDALLVDDRFGLTAKGYTINTGLISSQTSFIQTANIESETIQGSDHDDSFDVRSSVPDLNILGNGGDDLIFSESGTANIDTGGETPNTAGDSVVVNFGGSGSALRLIGNDHIGGISVWGGGTFQIPAGVTLDALSTPSLYPHAVLDMGGAMIVRNASSAIDQFGAWLGTGYANGAWDGTSSSAGAINSSLSAGTTIHDSVGYASAARLLNISGTQTATWQGQTVDATCVLVKYTYAGDANLDGRINIDDYGRIDSNVGQSGSVFGWYYGDFNYDQKINIDDYGIIDSNIGAQGPPIGEAPVARAGSFIDFPALKWAGSAPSGQSSAVNLLDGLARKPEIGAS